MNLFGYVFSKPDVRFPLVYQIVWVSQIFSLNLQLYPSYLLIGMQVLLESERQRADKFEKKFSEALETIEVMRVKMEETERRVLQLQEADRRVLHLQDYDCFCLV